MKCKDCGEELVLARAYYPRVTLPAPSKTDAPCSLPFCFHRPDTPEIVTLCGSTRFSEAFRRANLYETLAEHIVLTIGCDFKSDDALGLDEGDKQRLDQLHLHKVEMADQVLVLNVGDYLGESTRRELAHAIHHCKRVRFLGSHTCDALCPCLDARYMQGHPIHVVRWGSNAYFDFCNEWRNRFTVYGVPTEGVEFRPLSGDRQGRIVCNVTFASGARQSFCFDARSTAERGWAASQAEQVARDAGQGAWREVTSDGQGA